MGVKLTVCALRKAMDGLQDDMPVVIEIAEPDGSDLAQAHLRIASVESRCDEVDRFYLWGDVSEDTEEWERRRALTVIDGGRRIGG